MIFTHPLPAETQRRWKDFGFFKKKIQHIAKLKKEIIFLEKYAELKVELNARDEYGYTAFHWACKEGHFKIAKILMEKSADILIDLNAKNKRRHLQTAFQIANFQFGNWNSRNKIIEMIVNNAESFSIDLSDPEFGYPD